MQNSLRNVENHDFMFFAHVLDMTKMSFTDRIQYLRPASMTRSINPHSH